MIIAALFTVILNSNQPSVYKQSMNKLRGDEALLFNGCKRLSVWDDEKVYRRMVVMVAQQRDCT